MAEEDQPAQLSLAELCSICHENPQKYKCPRCASRTCSLACSKRHKLWSQCSGVRDPAEFLKKNELATPAAFDKDFNFITGIERSLERADIDAKSRGVHLGTETRERKPRKHSDHVRGEIPLQRGLERSGARIVKAPKGMSRSKLNTSNWHKKQRCLNWAVEWIFPSGQRTMSKCLETASVWTALSQVPLMKELGGSTNVRKVTERTAKKRKLSTRNTADTKAPVSDGHTDIATEKFRNGDTTSYLPTDDVPLSLQSVPPSEGPLITNPHSTTQLPPGDNPLCHTDRPRFYLYLDRPQTHAQVPVLIPITDQSKSLGDVISGKTILEFPTFYILEQSPDELTEEKYLSEDKYIAQYPDGEESEDSSRDEGEIDEEEELEIAKKLVEVNALKVMEVLKKDLGGI